MARRGKDLAALAALLGASALAFRKRKDEPSSTISSTANDTVSSDAAERDASPTVIRELNVQEQYPEGFKRLNPAAGDADAPRLLRTTFAKGGKVSSASKRADGIAKRGKTRGKIE